MRKVHMLECAIGSALLIASVNAFAAPSATPKDECRARQITPVAKLAQGGSGAVVPTPVPVSPCALPPVAAVLPGSVPAPATAAPAARSGFFGLPLLGALAGLGLIGAAAGGGGDSSASP